MPVSPPFPKGLKMKAWFCGNGVECSQGGSIRETKHSCQGKLDGFSKSPSAALRFIFRHCGVLLCTPHSSRHSRALHLKLFTVPSALTASQKVIKLRLGSTSACPSTCSGGQLLISEFCKSLLFYAEEMGDLMHHCQLDLLLQLLQGFTCFLQRFLEKQNAIGE